MAFNTRWRWILYTSAFLWLALLSLWLLPTLPVLARAPGATIAVNTTADELNSDGDCSLREAVVAANTNAPVDGCVAGSGADTIFIPDGDYILTINGMGEDNAATGDLDIREAVTIQGTLLARVIGGQGGTSGFTDRLFHVLPAATGMVYFETVTIRGGAEGGILTEGGTTVILQRVEFHDNRQGVRSLGALTVTGSTFVNNSLYVQNGSGAGLQSSGVTIIENSLFAGNRIIHREFGALSSAGTVNGAGWAHIGDAPASINNGTFVANGWFLGPLTDSGNGTGAAIYATHPLTAANLTLGAHLASAMLNTPRLLDGPIHLRNSIMVISEQVPLGCSANVLSLGFNMSTGGDCTMFTAEGDQLNVPEAAINLQPLAYNGGETWTMALGAGSVAIDTGTTADCPFFDQRLQPRPEDGDGDGESICDRGAFELGDPTPDPTATATATATLVPSPTPTVTATATVTVTPTVTPPSRNLYLPLIRTADK